jgi:hypothetical protein
MKPDRVLGLIRSILIETPLKEYEIRDFAADEKRPSPEETRFGSFHPWDER